MQLYIKVQLAWQCISLGKFEEEKFQFKSATQFRILLNVPMSIPDSLKVAEQVLRKQNFTK